MSARRTFDSGRGDDAHIAALARALALEPDRAIGRREQTEADFRRARELIIGSGALDATLDLAADYADKAKAALLVFPANDWREALDDLADFAVSRRA